jgi:beta-lactamase regulating signal transducer with metallopeptidase domain
MLQSLLVLAVAAVLCLLWRRAAAATRHLIWFLAIASLPLLLCLSLFPHYWHQPLWSVTTGFDSGNKLSVSLNLVPSSKAANSIALDSARTAQDTPNARPNTLSGPAFVTQLSSSWLVFAFLFWAGGAALGGLSIVVGQARLRRWPRNATPLTDHFSGKHHSLRGTSSSSNPIVDWNFLTREACETLGLRRAPALLLSSEDLMPLTWGWLWPRVLLPAEATNWPVEKCRVVLLHELAHVKRRDCLTQFVAELICALFWVNPLVWLAAHQMCVERERACDDLVLNGGCRPSDYATQLLDIARSFRHVRVAAGIAMARTGQLQGRIAAIIDGSRERRPQPAVTGMIVGLMALLVAGVAGTGGQPAPDNSETSELRRQQIDQLKSFSLAKEKQSQVLAAKAGEIISPEFKQFFDAAIRGDYQTVTNRYEYYKRHNPQYTSGTNAIESLHTAFWSPVLEICLAYDHVANCEPKYTRILARDILESVPAGSIYFGGTDPGRGVPTAFAKSSIEGDPFFCLTQNALADGSYLDYLRAMYGGKIYTPTSEDSQKCFQDYVADAQRRLGENKLKPGENVRKVDNEVKVSGQVAVMSINALLAKVIFEKNPDREFYIEESFPLDWMYPYLEPHGLIMKINRQPQPQLAEDVLARDREYWRKMLVDTLGVAVDDSTPVSELVAFVTRVYARKDLNGFTGDPLYIQNDYTKKIFSKLRSAIAGVYAWRLSPEAPPEFRPNSNAETERLVKQADLAFRQAFALCPYSPEAVFRYVSFLAQFKRFEDARLVAQASLEVNPQNAQVKDLLRNIENMTKH